MRSISVSKSPTTAPSTCETSSTKPHPPTADAWPPVSPSAYQRVPSTKSLAWARPRAHGRTPTWPTSTQPELTTHRTEAINRHHRTRQTHRQRLPQPHQLPTPNTPQRRRPRCLHPHPTLKSRIWEDSRRCQAGVDVYMAYGHGLGIYVLACGDCVRIMHVIIWLVFRRKHLYMDDLPL